MLLKGWHVGGWSLIGFTKVYNKVTDRKLASTRGSYSFIMHVCAHVSECACAVCVCTCE